MDVQSNSCNHSFTSLFKFLFLTDIRHADPWCYVRRTFRGSSRHRLGSRGPVLAVSQCRSNNQTACILGIGKYSRGICESWIIFVATHSMWTYLSHIIIIIFTSIFHCKQRLDCFPTMIWYTANLKRHIYWQELTRLATIQSIHGDWSMFQVARNFYRPRAFVKIHSVAKKELILLHLDNIFNILLCNSVYPLISLFFVLQRNRVHMKKNTLYIHW